MTMTRYIDADAMMRLIPMEEIVARMAIANAPTADVVERKVGKWIKNDGRHGWHCSECGEDNYYAYSWSNENGEYEFQDHYCPNCGAEMKGEDGGNI